MDIRNDSIHTEKGASLARGPAWIVGSVLAVFGLVFFFRAGGDATADRRLSRG